MANNKMVYINDDTAWDILSMIESRYDNLYRMNNWITATNAVVTVEEFKDWWNRHFNESPDEYAIDNWKEYQRLLSLAISMYRRLGQDVPDCYSRGVAIR